MIKSVLDHLQEQELRRLMVAFEAEVCQIVKLPMGRFVGVNVGELKHLNVTERAGVWAYGTINGADDD
jgi:hypothetical protein